KRWQGEGEKYRDRDLRSLKRQNPTEIVGFVSSLLCICFCNESCSELRSKIPIAEIISKADKANINAICTEMERLNICFSLT
ncbi:hypothetical protein ACKE52_20635, partial [Yersinia enterocolitica]